MPDIGGHTTAGVRSHATAARPRRCPRTPRAAAILLRHRRHAGADRRASRERARARGGLEAAGPPGAALRLVACVSGRSAAEARRLVGVGSIAYAGSHGAELLEPGAAKATTVPAFASWEGRVREFAAEQRHAASCGCCACGWRTRGRSSPSTGAARPTRTPRAPGSRAWPRRPSRPGFSTHWGRKVLEIRPPVPVDKGQAVRTLCERAQPAAALYAGDDATDLDAFERARRAEAEGVLDDRHLRGRALRRGAGRDRRARRPRRGRGRRGHRRAGGARSDALPRVPARVGAAVRRVGHRAGRRDHRRGQPRQRLRARSARRRVVAGRAGHRSDLGRRQSAQRGTRRLLSSARTATSLPELEPGAVLFNRMWPLAVFTDRRRGRSASSCPRCRPSPPATRSCSRSPLATSTAPSQAIEERDGVQYWFDRTPPLSAPRLVRTPGLRRMEPTPGATTRPSCARLRSRVELGPRARVRHLLGLSQARRAVATPNQILWSVSTPCASESIISVTPASRRRRAPACRAGRAGWGWR